MCAGEAAAITTAARQISLAAWLIDSHRVAWVAKAVFRFDTLSWEDRRAAVILLFQSDHDHEYHGEIHNRGMQKPACEHG